MSIQNLYAVLEERGFVEQISGEGIQSLFEKEKVGFYVGFDPTASSLHLGHLVPIMALVHCQRAGHQAILVVGGATGMIGDPSGKSSERNLLTVDNIRQNQAAVKKQLESFLSFEGENPALVLNNLDWLGEFSMVDWLREVGKFFPLGYMLAKESVKKRMEERGGGMSYTEFSYQMLQGYDFYHLFKKYNCRVQGGGNDQWGNITAGTEFIRRREHADGNLTAEDEGGAGVFGLTFPLLTTSDGSKFGKTAGNAVWLDREQTSVWDFYQYWINTSDEDAEKFLKLFTFLPLEEIAAVMEKHTGDPAARHAQKALAREITGIVHSPEEAAEMEEAAAKIFSGKIAELPPRLIRQALGDSHGHSIARAELETGISLAKCLVETSLCKSKGEAKRKFKEGAVAVNEKKESEDRLLTGADLLEGEPVILLRLGKKKYGLVEVG